MIVLYVRAMRREVMIDYKRTEILKECYHNIKPNNCSEYKMLDVVRVFDARIVIA